MKKKLLLVISFVVIVVVSGLLFLMQPSLFAKADYDGYDLFTKMDVSQKQCDIAVSAMNEMAISSQISATGYSYSDMINYLLKETPYSPYYDGTSKKFTSAVLTKFYDGLYMVHFNESSTCYAYAKYASGLIYGEYNPISTVYPESNSAEDLKSFMLLNAQPGEHIRWSYQHSGIFVSATEEGIYYLSRIKGGDICLAYFTYKDMSKYKNVKFFIYNDCKEINKSADVEINNNDASNKEKEVNKKNTEETTTPTPTPTPIPTSTPTPTSTPIPTVESIATSSQIEYRWQTIKKNISTQKTTSPLSSSDWTLIDETSETVPSSEWSEWQDSQIKGSSILEVETKKVKVETSVITGEKEFNYSHYVYYNNNETWYTWSASYAKSKGGTGEPIYRGWGEELFLYTLYDGTQYGGKDSNGIIWFYEESRDISEPTVTEKTMYRSRAIVKETTYTYEHTDVIYGEWSEWSTILPTDISNLNIQERE